MSVRVEDSQAIQDEFETLRQGFSTLLMATVGPDGMPEASYAAYLERGGDYYIYVSELSTHTGNLLANGRASVLFIEDEAGAGHLFARKRLTLKCEAAEVARGCREFDETLQAMLDRFGSVIETLRGLDDFHLFRLRPLRGVYVAGFARAYAMDDPSLSEIRHMRDKGHRRRDGQTNGSDQGLAS